jgi:hypothetical protein
VDEAAAAVDEAAAAVDEAAAALDEAAVVLDEVVGVLDVFQVEVTGALDEVVVEFWGHSVSFPDTAPRPAKGPDLGHLRRSQPLWRPTCRPGYASRKSKL